MSALIRLRHSKVASVLKLEHFVAPAGPSGLKTPGEELQTPGFRSDVGLQHVWRTRKRRRRMTTGGVRQKSGGSERPPPCVWSSQPRRQLVPRMGNEITPQPFFFFFFLTSALCRYGSFLLSRGYGIMLLAEANVFRPRSAEKTYINKQREGHERPLGSSDLCIGFSNSE